MTELERAPWPQGCLQVYTGNGKGKTTAAFGLAVRAAGRGLKVFIGQFMKGSEYGELEGARMLGGLVCVEQFGSPQCIPRRSEPNPEDIELARKGLARAREVMLGGEYSIVVLDEISVALYFELVDEAALLDLVDARPSGTELVCTGRYAPQSLISRADLVTEMQAVKHPYDTHGLLARDGIER